MKRTILWTGALSGSLVTASLMGIIYLADQLAGLPFVPFDLFDWITRVLPGPLVTFGIDAMIDTMRLVGISVAATAKTAEQVIAVLQFFFLGVVAGVLFFTFLRLRGGRPSVAVGIVAGAGVGLPVAIVSIAIGGSDVQPALVVAWLEVLFVAWGVGLRQVYVSVYPAEAVVAPSSVQTASDQTIDRRTFLVRVGAATATITVASSGLGVLLSQAARRELDAALTGTDDRKPAGIAEASMPNADDPIVPARGTRPEYTPVDDHYQVFIKTRPTVIDGASWTLPISGLVENPVALTLDDIREGYEARDQFVTLSCISGRVGTDLISTTHWTGARVEDILETVRPEPDARYMYITSGDGFYETVALELINSDERIMLCYDWDHRPLPIDHGFPLRIWLPDRFGMKQPKWITGIELIGDYKQGYWVERGWDEVARVMATSVIDTVAVDDVYERDGAKFVPVGGIAFAGARGVSKVEVRVDGGPWQEAQLRAPLSETTWVVWRFDWPFEAGGHELLVRCAEGDGTPQIEKSRGNRPSGATGIHRKFAKL